jgi:phosphoribosylformylglycinamidine (FGAM) synthase-like enzyme
MTRQVGGDTVQAPGGDAAWCACMAPKRRSRSAPIAPRAIASPIRSRAASRRWPNAGATHAVGAKPLAITDNLNFGNPQRPRSWARSSAPRRHGRRLPRARFPDRVRQRLALQRARPSCLPAAAARRSCPRPAGNIGAIIQSHDSTQAFDDPRAFFAEDQGVYIVTISDAALSDFLAAGEAADVRVQPIGRTCGSRLLFELADSDHAIPLDTLRTAHEGFFPALMDQ